MRGPGGRKPEMGRWAPGLKLMLKMALKEWCEGLEPPMKIEIQALRADAKGMWKNHVRNGHYPARRDCSVCVQAAGRSKSHRKIQHPDYYTLSACVANCLQGRTSSTPWRSTWLSEFIPFLSRSRGNHLLNLGRRMTFNKMFHHTRCGLA